MTYARIRPAVFVKMHADGIEIDAHATMPQVRIAVENATQRYLQAGESQPDYLARYLRGFTSTKVEPYQRVWKKKVAHIHPRLAEINAGQPPMKTPCGTGNYTEFSKEWGNER